MEKWEDIIREEIKKMMTAIQGRGVAPDFINVSVNILLPHKTRKNSEGYSDIEVESIDDILKKIRKNKQEKECSCCGKKTTSAIRLETGEYVCPQCNEELNLYRDKIKEIVQAYNENASITSLIHELAEQIIDRQAEKELEEMEDENEEMLADFIENELLNFAQFDKKEELVEFLNDVINYINSHDIDM